MNRKQIEHKLKQKLSDEDRERLHQHLFHLDQEQKLKQTQPYKQKK
jgi:hypothetical protein|tara:strand:+ start:1619 stop:1756 length:138 start_codon:yes stop_codon:yes gene_type:complete